MIVKPLSPDDPYGLLPDEELPEPPVDVEVEGLGLADKASGVIENEDGTVTVEFGDDDKEASDLKKVPHYDNLAEVMSEEELSEVSCCVMEAFEADLSGRTDWEESLAEGIGLLGIKMEERTKPWVGAAGVHDPILMEAVVRFQSQAIMEIFPPAGPAKTRIQGKEDSDKKARALRMQDEINYQLTTVVKDYRAETERLLFSLGLTGAAFRKIYYDPARKAPCAKFVPAEDFVIPYGDSTLSTAERFTHVLRLTKNQLKRYQASGLYRKDVDLDEPGEAIPSEVKEKESEAIGIEPTAPHTDRYTVLEMHVDLDIEDGEYDYPYVVCVDKASGKVLSIRRNWREGDENHNRRSWFVGYEYIPGIGPYGLGLVHIIGSVAKGATAMLRQLIDAGTLAVLPGGLKAKGLRIKGDDTPIRPGEFRDVDIAMGKVQDSIMTLPYKEPSAVVMQLRRELVEDGRRVGSIADADVGDMTSEAPVGTTLALLERAQKVMSAVQARLHASLAQELQLIAEIIRDDMDPKYNYDGLGEFDRRADFAASGVEIIPVSDPGASTMSQRVVQHQAAMQMASQAPQLYDMPKMHRSGLEVLGIKNAAELVPMQDEMKPRDPVTENAAILKGEPVKAFISQDHKAHIAVHMAAAQDPKIQQLVGQSPSAPIIMAAMQAHVMEHIAFAYRQEMEQAMGGQLPQPDQEITPEQEAQIAQAAVPAAQQLFQQHSQEKAQEQAEALAQDPMVMLQTRELAIKEADLERKERTDMAKIQADAQRTAVQSLVEISKVQAQQEITGAKLGVEIGKATEDVVRRSDQHAEQLAHDYAKHQEELATRRQIAASRPHPSKAK